jgi:hypothetical protein
MIAEKAYKKTPVGSQGKFSCVNEVAGGPSDGKQKTYALFAEQIKKLEEMAAKGLITINSRHTESQTGKHHVDTVVFTRLT